MRSSIGKVIAGALTIAVFRQVVAVKKRRRSVCAG
jgi:hypothetical protein